MKDKILNWKNRNFVSWKYVSLRAESLRIKPKTSKTEKLSTHTRVKEIATEAYRELECDKQATCMWHLFSFGKKRDPVKGAQWFVLVIYKNSYGNQRTRAITGFGLPKIRVVGCSLFSLALGPYTAGTVELQHLKVHVKGKLSWSNCFCEVA